MALQGKKLKNPIMGGVLALLLGALGIRIGGGSKVAVSGQVRTQGGAAPGSTVVFVLDDEMNLLGFDQCDSQGRFEAKVQGRSAYIVAAYAQMPEGAKPIRGFTHMVQNKRVPRADGEAVRVDFNLPPAGNLILEAYDASGNQMRWGDFQQLGPDPLTAWKMDWSPACASALSAHDEYSQKHGSRDELGVPTFVAPVGETFQVNVLFWPVPGAGKLWLQADNGGQGFRFSRPGEVATINLSYELARTRLHALEGEINRGAAAIPQPAWGELSSARSLLEQARAARSGAEKARLAEASLKEGILASEALALARAEQEISLYRKGKVAISLRDASGRPVPEAEVKFRQTEHSFNFGVWSPYDRAAYQKMRQAGVNYASLYACWDAVQPRKGELLWEKADEEYRPDALSSEGFRIQLACLAYFLAPTVPDYVKRMSASELKDAVSRYVGAAVSHYRREHPGSLKSVQVINEPNQRATSLNLTLAEMMEVIRAALDSARIAAPDLKTVINFPWDSGRGRPCLLLQPDGKPLDDYGLTPWQFIPELKRRGIWPDMLGFQCYPGARIKVDWADIDAHEPAVDLARLSDFFDRCCSFGLPVEVSELSVPSSNRRDWKNGYWRKPWDEETQADFLKAAYTIAFSEQAMRGITWFNATDKGSFVTSGGLLGSDGKPKRAFDVLSNLIRQWTTSGAARTDGQGKVVVEGFGGDYVLDVARGGQTRSFAFSIDEQQTKQIELTW
jgi:GH35 family endo-1,4-beta-xylanase